MILVDSLRSHINRISVVNKRWFSVASGLVAGVGVETEIAPLRTLLKLSPTVSNHESLAGTVFILLAILIASEVKSNPS